MLQVWYSGSTADTCNANIVNYKMPTNVHIFCSALHHTGNHPLFHGHTCTAYVYCSGCWSDTIIFKFNLIKSRVKVRSRVFLLMYLMRFPIIIIVLYSVPAAANFASSSTKRIITVTIKYVMYANKSLILTLTLNPIYCRTSKKMLKK